MLGSVLYPPAGSGHNLTKVPILFNLPSRPGTFIPFFNLTPPLILPYNLTKDETVKLLPLALTAHWKGGGG